MKSAKERLLELHEDVHGGGLSGNESELSLMVDILEQLAEKSAEQESHSHSIS